MKTKSNWYGVVSTMYTGSATCESKARLPSMPKQSIVKKLPCMYKDTLVEYPTWDGTYLFGSV